MLQFSYIFSQISSLSAEKSCIKGSEWCAHPGCFLPYEQALGADLASGTRDIAHRCRTDPKGVNKNKLYDGPKRNEHKE